MSKIVVKTLEAPAAVGAYSQAVTSEGFAFCSGQIGLDPETGELVKGTVADETRRCLDNLAAVLDAAGSSLVHVVKTTVYLTDMNDFAEFNEAYAEYFATDPPARATVGVAALPKGARVEVECIARI
ncbi:MAG TPA: RidA family protein [Actinomycetota bacterium]|nr:RidA family protein [Actinomycetota bacterium]